MKLCLRLCSFLLVTMVSSSLFAKQITYMRAEAEKDQYHIDLLKFLYKDSDDQLVEYSTDLTYGRQMVEIESGALSVAAFATGIDIEKRLQPIRIPILRGLLGHRIFIIKDGDQHRFENIQNIEQLKHLKAGQGKFWSDTEVLKSAGIETIANLKYNGLFYMLEGGRFDYFPRGVHEPFSEIASVPELNLAVEPKLMLVYPLALYLFVSKDNQALATDIENKLEKAIADGSFDDFFYNHPLIQDVLKNVHIKQRRIFRINNPHLPPQTPLDREELWLNVDDIPDDLD